MSVAVWLLAGYLVGSIPTSYLAAKYGARIDLREHGSKNLGATNVYRTLGWKYAVPVGMFDIAKGLVPVLAAPRVGERPWLSLAVGTAAVVGHVFSVFVRFRGGKGVATAAGVVLALEPLSFGVSALAWIGVVAATRIVSLASIASALAFPITVRVVHPTHDYTFAAGIALAGFIVFTHRANIRRLLSGTEHRFSRRDGSC